MEALLRKIYESGRAAVALKVLYHLVSLLSVLGAGYMLFLSLSDGWLLALKLTMILAIPFLAVTAIRRLINAPRPYELYSFYGEAPKNKKGASFPSRHAHSAFAIGTLLVFFSPYFGAALLFLSLAMCTSRVLLGIHFIRDVACGAAIGVLAGIIGKLLF